MSALFPQWTNTLARVSLFCLAATLVLAFVVLFLWVRSPLFTRQDAAIDQPVPFDHRHHVADCGIDCRYCHDTVDRSSSAGLPSTSLCLNCHSQIWNRSSLLEPVRASYFTNRPIPWRRVYQLPDFVYFNHAIHLAKGVGCVTCHGRVDTMAAIEQAPPLTMGWCLDCHRAPEKNLRPREFITSMTWHAEGDALALGEALAARYEVHTRTSCTTCHR
jgi:hypothetical protein